MLKRVCVCAVLLGSSAVWAAPTAPIEVELTQPDTGETFWARPQGDERASWMETADGFTILEGPGKVWYFADQEAGGNLISTGIRVDQDVSRAALHVPQHLSPPPNPEMTAYKRVIKPLGHTKSLTHTQKVLTILVDFSDITFTYSDAAFQSLMYGATDSVKEFFLENSYDGFTVAPAEESYGTVNDGVVHVAMGTAHPNLGNGDWRASVATYISAANGSVDFSSFDTDANGSLSVQELSIVLILAGYENSYGGDSAPTPRVWGHAWSMSSPLVLDTKSLQPYTVFGERHSTHQATIGIMCHELGHLMLGLPDLYDIGNRSRGVWAQ